jgi:uncharacterized protein YkwD
MPRILALLLAMVLCGCAFALAKPAEAAPTEWELRLISKVNQVRAAHGVRRLRIGPRLQRGAHSWAVHLIRSDSFHHASLGSGTGENLAWGTCNWLGPSDVVRMWMNSYAHRVTLLRRGYRYIGGGMARGAWNGYGCVRMAVARFR